MPAAAGMSLRKLETMPRKVRNLLASFVGGILEMSYNLLRSIFIIDAVMVYLKTCMSIVIHYMSALGMVTHDTPQMRVAMPRMVSSRM